MNPRNIPRAAALRKLRGRQIAAFDGNFNGLYQWPRPHRLSVDTHHFRLLDCLVQMITLKSVALSGEDHRCRPARAPKGVEHVKPVERVLDGVIVPGKVGDHYVKPQAVADRALDRSLILSDPHRGVAQALLQNGLDDLSQRGGDQNTWPVLHFSPQPVIKATAPGRRPLE